MPIYCYEAADGQVFEELFPFGKAPRRIKRNGKVAKRSLQIEHKGGTRQSANWPMESDAAGVHPSQIKEAYAHSRSIGVPTEFTSEGCAVFTSALHRKRYCEAVGLYDRNGGYSDPQRRRS